MENLIPKIDILGTKVDDISFVRAVNEILELSEDKKGRHIVVTINSEFVMMARRNGDFAKILQKADVSSLP